MRNANDRSERVLPVLRNMDFEGHKASVSGLSARDWIGTAFNLFFLPVWFRIHRFVKFKQALRQLCFYSDSLTSFWYTALPSLIIRSFHETILNTFQERQAAASLFSGEKGEKLMLEIAPPRQKETAASKKASAQKTLTDEQKNMITILIQVCSIQSHFIWNAWYQY